MIHSIRLEVTGSAACFTRPEFKVERVSYDCMTPSAAVGVLKAIYWHPGMDYEIERIFVCNPIKQATIMRNEVCNKGNGKAATSAYKKGLVPKGISASALRTQRSTLYLKDVRYVIEAHIVLREGEMHESDNLTKFYQIFLRRAKNGQSFHHPYLGCREFPVRTFRLLGLEEDVEHADIPDKVLGLMLHSLNYQVYPNKPRFFPAEIRDGILEVEGREIYQCS